jgi:hypothetical protein
MVRHTSESIGRKQQFMSRLSMRLGHPSNEFRVTAALRGAMQAFSEVFTDDDVALVERELRLSPEFRNCVCRGCALYDRSTQQCAAGTNDDVKVAIGCLLELYVAIAKRENTIESTIYAPGRRHEAEGSHASATV